MDNWELVVRESVRQTLADYTAGTDRFRLDDLAACFAPEGALEFPGSEPMVGPAAIAAGLGTQLGGSPPVRSTPLTHVRHHVSSVRFSAVTPDRVEVTSYFVVFTDVGVDHWGRYRDVLIPGAGRWLFSSRRISVDGHSARSLMRPNSE
ncbi:MULTISPECIES: nuclear transport factor 2 family protein [unclassified Mycobacterium]|uniref:nuclear transport factor 2 family protein n=1 Tax=unclassified Mycobacterium TaxID=2642494 RepID=UPI0029C97880|nr:MULTISPECIES: nuclear transport factor 2 family protein [unclassified Mycobacterium]